MRSKNTPRTLLLLALILAGTVATAGPTQADQATTLNNPLGNLSDPRLIIGQAIRVSLGIIGSLALILFIYGGMIWMMSSGNTEMITKGRNTLLWAVIGLIVVFGSYTIINFVLQNLPRG